MHSTESGVVIGQSSMLFAGMYMCTSDAVFVTCAMWMHRRVVLWDWELLHFQAYVYIIFVYRVVYVDMSTRSSQLNHLNLES